MSKDSASLLGWFGKRKEGVVGDGLRSMFISVRDCVTELGKAIRATADEDGTAAKKAIDRLFICERETDSVGDDLCNQISIGELAPQEREDLMRFIRNTDSIANWAKEAAINIRLIDEVGIQVPRDVWDMLARTVSDLESEVSNLSSAIRIVSGELSGDTLACIRDVRALERAIDQTYFDVMKELFRSGMDQRAVLLMTRITDAIEMAADTCKTCSDTVAIMHHARTV